MLAEKLPPQEGENEILAFPLSFAQQRLWFLDQLYPGNVAYNVPFAVRIAGDLDVPTMAAAFAVLVERHEPLRTTFATIGSEPIQVVSDPAPVPVSCADLRGLAPEAREEETRRLAREEARRPFDLRRGPLLRVTLLRTGAREHLLLLSLHHIVCDGWSLGVLLADIAALYEPLAVGREPELPELPIQYADFALWQREWLQGEALESRLAYWRGQLAGAPGLLELPTDRPRPATPGFEGGTVRFSFPEELSRRALALAAELRCSSFMLLLAAFDALLYRYTGQEDVLVGTPIANRNRSDLEPLIGFFVNTLVLRARPRPDLIFAALAEEVRAAALEAFARQDVPFEKLLEELQPERSASVTPLFQVMLVFQNAPAGRLEIPGLELEGVPVEPDTSKLDLTLHLAEEEGRLRGALVYRAELFDAPTVRRLAAHLETLLAGAVAAPETRLADLPLLSPAERQQAVLEWNDSGSSLLSGMCVHELFEEQAVSDPGAPALVFEEERLTRGELNARANRLAWRMRELGVGPEVPVGLCLERSAGAIVALLAVLKAGGAYLPLDPALPAERLRYMLELSSAPVLVTRGGLAARLGLRAPAVLDLDETASDRTDDPPRAAGPGNLAYVLFTSGSTGRPKGVAVEHRHLVAYLAGVGERLQVPEGGSYATVSTLAADLGNTAIFPALCLGGCLHVLAEERLADPEAMEAYFRREEVDCLKIVPSHLAALRGTLARRELVLGGEASHWEEVERLRSGAPWLGILNHYGPTEATVGVLTFRVPAGRPGRHGRLPLGRPLAGARVHLLDRSGNPIPAGVTGELHIGGASLTRVYLRRPDLTAERFVPDPFGEPGGRLYRTGDLARRLADGMVDFLGRADDQVKVRGYRVEPGEIEAVLAEHPGVRSATVQLRGERLVAWVATDRDAAELRRYLQERLPAYMVPAGIVPLEKIPLTAQGKVDRRALPDAESLPRERVRVAPSTPLETGVAAVWSEVLGVEEIGVHDSFFDLGGHSLLAAQAASRLRRSFGVDLPLRALFEAPTVAGLAAWIEGASGRTRPALVPLPRPAGEAAVFPVSFAQQRLWFLDRLEPGSAFYSIPRALRLEGDFDSTALAGAFQALVDRHESLRTTFAEGPAQVVAPTRRHDLPLIDLSGIASPEEETRRLAAEEAARPFDLARGPLLRTTLIRQAPQEHVLLVTVHHIVSDAWSAGVLLRDMAALLSGEPLPGLPVQAADVAVWQRQWLQGEELEAQLAAWRRRLAGAPPVLELPADRPRPPVQSYRGDHARFELPSGLSLALRELAAREQATPFMALLAGFAALLFRYTGETDLSIGTPVAGRTEVEMEGLIGFFVNTLVIRADLSGEPSFRELLGRVRERVIEAQAHQDVPFERLVEELAPERSLSHSPLFQVMAGLVNLPMAPPPSGGLRMVSLDMETPVAKFDLNLAVLDRPEGFAGTLEYASDLFHRSTALRLAENLRTVLEDLLLEPERTLSEARLMSEAERQQIAIEWNDTAAGGLPGQRLHDLFAAQAERTPDALAVIREGEGLTFGELRRRSLDLAARLRGVGVGPDVLVGISMDRTPEMMVALLGVLEAGGAYVPLDPSYPPERLRWIVEDSGAALVLRPGLRLDSKVKPSGSEPLPENLAYVIYTSGSTGRPKGVAVSHASAVDFLIWARDLFSDEDRKLVLASTSLNFDIAVIELFGPPSWGGTLVLADDVLSLPWDAGITLINTVPSAFAELLEAGAVPATVRTVSLGGEALRPDLADRIHARGAGWRLLNLYGPTEDTVYSTAEWVEPGAAPTIGRPAPNARAHVLDPSFRPVPIGVPGELLLGGAGQARGYLGRPDITAERFVPDPLGSSPGARLYRTGDRVRRLPNGRLEFLGRLDHQVKIRGFRIELGEIETALTGHPAVREAAVAACDAGLVAYVTGDASPAALRSHLEALLPAYMVPQRFVLLDALPRTPNGKVDRRALPEPEAALAGFAPPRTPREELLAGIWESVLGVERVGRHDHFFDLGGHSLLATRVLTRIREAFRVELPLRALFQAPTLAELASRIGEGTAAADPILPVPRDGRLPLSYAQQRLWFLHQLEPGSPAYNLLAHLRLAGDLSVPALQAALAEVVRRHEVLRTRYILLDEEPVQIPEPPAPFLLPLVDLAGLPAEAREAEMARLAREEARRPFDLGRAPVLRALLARLDRGEHGLLVSVHHVAADGWSLEILAREMAMLYAGSALPELPIQVADFAVWQRRRPLDAHLAFWREQLAGAPPLLALPTDRPRPALWSGRGATLSWTLRAGAVRERFRASGATLFMGLLAAFQTLLQRWSGTDDVVVGTPVSGRPTLETEALIGCFVNTLVLRGDLSGRPTARDLLARSRSAVLEAHDHQELPFEALVEALSPERSLSHAPLFQAMLAVQPASRERVEIPGLAITLGGADGGSAKFDLHLIVAEADGALEGSLEYAADLFDATTVRRLLDHLERLLEGFATRPDLPVTELPLLSKAELHQALAELDRTGTPFPEECLHRLFEARAAEQPESIALSWQGMDLTCAELNGRANRLARHLRSLGVGPEVRVEVCLDRTPDLVVALLAVLKAGGSYVPLDPAWPAERLRAIAAQSEAPVLLTRAGIEAPAEGRLRVEVGSIGPWPEHDLEGGALPGSLAYVIYTSGSTGVPKGVAIEHRAAAGLLRWAREVFPPEDLAGVLASTSVCFDLSVFELFVPLAWGGRVVLVQDALRLAELPPEAGVTLVNTVPSAVDELLRLGSLPATVRTVNLAGEPLEGALVARVPRGMRVLNLYGPSEDTTYSTWEEVPRDGEPTIGRPIAVTRACLLDAALQPVPPGVPGELFLGGAGSARGYLGRPDLTAASWVPDPFGPPGARLYRTGDLVRLRRDGRLEFLGRRDHQVKVRGFRIELGEVEAALASHPGVNAAVVVARGAGADRRLVAYVVGRDEGLRAWLQERLPSYMVPSAFVVLEALPLSPNGKVDRRALPEPGPARPEGGVPPRDELERRLAAIWEELLGVRPVGVCDDFFELGGHSLLAVRLLARIRRETGRDLPLSALFQRSTIEGLAALLREGVERPRSPLVAIQPEGARPPLFCVHPVGGNVLCYRDLGRHLARPLYALEYPGGLRTVEAMAERYLEAVREVRPRGPYHLAGWSSGGVIAFEMARRLAEAGEEVELALLDTFAPADVPAHDETEILLLHAWGLGLSLQDLTPLSDEERLRRILDRLPEDVGMAEIRRYLEVYRAILEAVRSYAPRPYAGRTLLIRCAEREDYGEYAHLFGRGPADPAPGWSGLATRLEIHDVQATHNRLVQEPAVAELAALLDRPRIFADVLRRRAAEAPDRPVYLFLDSEGQEAESLTYSELDRRARAIAAELQRQGGEGERALLLYPPGLEFLAAFWGCLYAGVVAVPAYPPRSGRTQPRLRAIAADADAALVLAPAAMAATREVLAERVPELAAARWIATDELSADRAPREPAAGPDDPAFLQYTSGSTADPKGVVVTHANLLANEGMIQRAFGQSEASLVVGWLPLYHDMGLIGNALQPVYSGGRAVLMSALTFLQRPARWLEAISRYRATTSGGPSFAYELCVRKVSAEERAGLDLSSWSVAFNGSEPVRAETLRRFAEAFEPCGFRPEAAYPCYGLAESTLFVTGGEPGLPPRIRSLRTDALERDEAVPAREGEPAREHVGCGHAWPGHRVLVVNPESGAPCEPGRVGEIWVAGPSVAAGYRSRPEATADTFGARLADGSGPFLRTGDLGFLDGGELFVTGRLKDLIILRGRNHYPQDFERTAEASHPVLRAGSGAAFSVEREGEERLVVVQEIEHERRAPGELEAIAEAARRAVAEEHEVAVEEVVLLRSGTVPKTSSGKVRRRACREVYLAGELVVVGRSLTEAAAPASGLREEVAGILRLPPDAVEPDRSLVALGLDSLAAVELKERVEDRFGVSLSLAALLEGATLADVAAEIGRGGSLCRATGEGRGGGLTLNQRALWFVERLSPGSYNLAGAARVHGGLDPEALRRAFQALADRHPALRTTFEEQDGEPVRRVHDRMEIDFGASADDLLEPFDLRRGSLMRVRLSDGVLSLGIHHLAADFRSLALLLRELGALYRGESLPPPDPEVVPREDTSEATWAWWRETLAGDLPVLDLATDRPRPPVQTYNGASRALRLEGERVRVWASSFGATLHTVLLVAFHALHRYTGQPDILVGVPTSGHGEAVGYFVNPVVIRASPS